MRTTQSSGSGGRAGAVLRIALAAAAVLLGTGAVSASYTFVEQVLRALEEEGLSCARTRPTSGPGRGADGLVRDRRRAGGSACRSSEDREDARAERTSSDRGGDVDGPRWSVDLPDQALAERVVEAIGREVQPAR